MVGKTTYKPLCYNQLQHLSFYLFTGYLTNYFLPLHPIFSVGSISLRVNSATIALRLYSTHKRQNKEVERHPHKDKQHRRQNISQPWCYAHTHTYILHNRSVGKPRTYKSLCKNHLTQQSSRVEEITYHPKEQKGNHKRK